MYLLLAACSAAVCCSEEYGALERSCPLRIRTLSKLEEATSGPEIFFFLIPATSPSHFTYNTLTQPFWCVRVLSEWSLLFLLGHKVSNKPKERSSSAQCWCPIWGEKMVAHQPAPSCSHSKMLSDSPPHLVPSLPSPGVMKDPALASAVKMAFQEEMTQISHAQL